MARKPETPDEAVEQPESHDKPESISPDSRRDPEPESEQDLLIPGQFIPYKVLMRILNGDSNSAPEVTHRFNFDTGHTLDSERSDEYPTSTDDDDNTSQENRSDTEPPPISQSVIPRNTNRPPVQADLINLYKFHSRKSRKKKD